MIALGILYKTISHFSFLITSSSTEKYEKLTVKSRLSGLAKSEFLVRRFCVWSTQSSLKSQNGVPPTEAVRAVRDQREHGREAKRLQPLQDYGLLQQEVPEGKLV